MIKINEKYLIGLDKYQWTVYQLHQPTKKRPDAWVEPKTHHPSLSRACQWLIHQNLADAIPCEVGVLSAALTDAVYEVETLIRTENLPDKAARAFRGVK